jgi:hypothetical protein
VRNILKICHKRSHRYTAVINRDRGLHRTASSLQNFVGHEIQPANVAG